MAQNIQRPAYYEGQRLSAADLTLAGEHARGQLARHHRYLHDWGIAEGLVLEARDRETAAGDKYVEVVLTPGVAIDGTGREIVVAEQALLSEEVFVSKNVEINQTDALYPVFLLGRDEAGTPPTGLGGACQVSRPTRWQEAFDIDFDRPGAELTRADEAAPAIASGPGGAWSILLGFVVWNTAIDRFTAVTPESGGIGRRYAGVRADRVVGYSGSLRLQASGGDPTGKVALALDEENGLLQFGKMDARGRVVPVFTVNDKGEIGSEVAAGPGLHVISGISYDGLLLPLPKGITQEDVADGRVTVHAHVTPRYDGAPISGGASMTPLECRLDGLRVHCRAQWSVSDNFPWLCDYTLTVNVPGGGS